MKLNNMPNKTRQNLYLQLADKINKFNEHANRKLELFLGSKNDLKRNLSQPASSAQTPVYNQNFNMQPQQPMMAQPMFTPQMPQTNMNTANGVTMNQAQQNRKRQLFIGQMLGGIGGGLGQAAGAVTGGVKDVASGLGANGGAGAGLLGAGAGLMMATMGSEGEEIERDNLQQDLRSKEFRFMMERGKKDTEMNKMDKLVRTHELRTNGRSETWRCTPMTSTRKLRPKFTC